MPVFNPDPEFNYAANIGSAGNYQEDIYGNFIIRIVDTVTGGAPFIYTNITPLPDEMKTSSTSHVSM